MSTSTTPPSQAELEEQAKIEEEQQKQQQAEQAAQQLAKLVNLAPLQLPQFIPRNPLLWIHMVESSFNTHHPRITVNQTKYDHMVKALPYNIAEEISDVITNQLGYDKLKEALINRFSESTERRFEKLLVSEELGDRKPSQLLRRLTSLSTGDNTVSPAVLRKLWIGRLPKSVQTVLQISTAEVEELAKMADKIMDIEQSNISEIQRAQPTTSATIGQNSLFETSATTTTDNNNINMVSQLCSLIRELKTEVSELRNRTENRGRPQSRRSSPARARSSSAPRQYDQCWYHWKFGAESKKCRKPCKFEKSEN